MVQAESHGGAHSGKGERGQYRVLRDARAALLSMTILVEL